MNRAADLFPLVELDVGAGPGASIILTPREADSLLRAGAATLTKPKRKKPKGKSPTQRSLAEMRGRGYDCAVVEHWNPHVGIRQDMFGVWDIVCLKPGAIVFLQCTTDDHIAHRVAKITEHDLIDTFRKCGARLLVQGWKKRAGRWQVREVDLS